MKTVVIVVLAIAIAALILTPGPFNDLRFVAVEAGPPYIEVREVPENPSLVKGAHFNIFPGPNGWDTDVAGFVLRDMGRKGFTNVLFFIAPSTSHEPNLWYALSTAKGAGMRTIVRIGLKYGTIHASTSAAETAAEDALFLFENFGVENFQFFNEADAFWDWDWGAICNNPAIWPNIWGVNVALACARYDQYGEDAWKVDPYLPVLDSWYWENWRRSVPGYFALGMYTASEVNAVMREMWGGVVGITGSPGYRPPTFMIAVPPVIVDDIRMEQYYDGFFAYWTSRRSGAWGLPIGGWAMAELPATVSPLVVFHIYSAEGIPAICNDSGAGVYENAADVVAKAVDRMTRVRGVASRGEYSLNLTLRNFIVSEAGPSPEVIKEACGPNTRIPNNMRAWARLSAMLAQQQNAPPLMVWIATFHWLVNAAPSGEMAYWESTALYPYELCNQSLMACVGGEE